jgi:hypothetical protein
MQLSWLAGSGCHRLLCLVKESLRQVAPSPRLPRERPSTFLKSMPDAAHKDITALRRRFRRLRIGEL